MVENTGNTQLSAMGSHEDFRRLWSFPGDNPFATQRGTIPQRPSPEDVQVATNILSKSDPEMPPQADWPKQFTKKNVDWCESRLKDGLCCAHKLFEAPLPITNLQDLSGCTLLAIPETQVRSPYYNPLFMPKEALKPAGNFSQIVEVYKSMESLERQEQEASLGCSSNDGGGHLGTHYYSK